MNIDARPKVNSLLALAIAGMMLSACGSGGDKAATQVAAKVNKDEISVHQINYVLSHAGNVPADQVKPASRQVLEKLIDQDLLIQKAMDAKLDREPGVMQAIESNKRQILAQAYLERVAAAATKPTAAEVTEYYGKHPELFGQRRIYRFQQLVVSGDKDVVAKVQAQIGKSTSMDGLAEWAKQNNLRFSTNAAVKAAEQLPMDLLPRLQPMKDGQMAVIVEPPAGVSVLQLVASQEQPIDEKAAAPVIEQYLFNRRKTDLTEKELKQLRDAAKIEYLGDFAKPAAAQEKAAATPAAVPAAAANAGHSTESLKKGVAGL